MYYEVKTFSRQHTKIFFLFFPDSDCLAFNDMSALVGHFVLSPREREKRDRRDRRRDEREEQGRKRNRNESEETEEKKNIPHPGWPHIFSNQIP